MVPTRGEVRAPASRRAQPYWTMAQPRALPRSPLGTSDLVAQTHLNIADLTQSDILDQLRRRILDMKQFLAACVAIAVLWAIELA